MEDRPARLLQPEEVGRLLTPLLAALASPLAMVFGDRHLVLIHNQAWHRLTQECGAGLVGQPIAAVFPSVAELIPDAAAGARTVPAVPAAGPGGGVTWWDLELLAHPDDRRVTILIARDVTEHVLARRDAEQAELSLRSAGTWLRLVQEATGVGTWEWSRRSNRQSWSPEQFRLHGMDPDRDPPPAFDEWLAMVHPDDRAMVLAAADRGFQEAGAAHQYDLRIRRADTREERWLLCLARTAETAPDGRPQRIVGINVDVTARRREEAALRASEARLRLAFDAAQIFAWSWDVASGAVAWDPGLEAAHGLPPGGFGGTVDAFRALVHPDDLPRVEEALRRALVGEQARYEAEFRMRRADGTWRWTITRGIVLRDTTGQPSRVIGVDYDITARRHGEALLRDSEARLRLAMMSAQLGTWEKDLGSGVTVWDDTLAALLGVPPESAGEADAWLHFVVPEEREAVAETYRAAVAARRGFAIEFRVRRADGAVRIFIGRGLPAGAERMVGVVQDVTEARLSEALLLESRSRYQGLFDSLEQFVGLVTPDGRLLKINRWVLDVVQAPAAAVLDRPIWELDWWDRADRTAERLRRSVAQARGGKFVRRTLRLAAAGRLVPLDMTLRPVRDGDGAVTLIALEGREVQTPVPGHGRRASQALELVHAIPQVAFAAGADGASTFVNRFWFDYSGQPVEQALGYGWLAHIHPDDRERTIAAWTAALESTDPYEIEHRVRDAEGIYRWFLTRAVARTLPSAATVQRWYGASTDIDALVRARDTATEEAHRLERLAASHALGRRIAAEQLKGEATLRADAERALLQARKVEALGQLTATVIHDFNNVLAVITSCISLIRRRTAAQDILELATLGERALAKAAGLVRQLLGFMQGRTRSSGVLDVVALVDGLAPFLRQALAAGVTLETDVAPDAPEIIGHPEQLEITLLNLVVNARDAMPDGGRILLQARRNGADAAAAEGGWLALSVRDTGTGIPPEILSRVMEPFFTTKAKGKGTGLGLASVRELVTQMGGRLQIDSTVGLGTTVTLLVPPASFLPQAGADADGAGSAGDAMPQGEGTILLLEDRPHLRGLIAGFLRRSGYKVTEATIADARAVPMADAPDLVIIDTPEWTAGSAALVGELRQRHPQPAVLCLVPARMASDTVPHRVLRTPFTGGALHHAVRDALGRPPAPAAPALERLLGRIADPRLRDYCAAWYAEVGRSGRLPSLADLPPMAFGLQPVSFTVAVEAATPRLFHYIAIGKRLAAQLGLGQEAELVSRDAEGDEVIGSLDGAYRRAERSRAPVYQSARFDFGDGAPMRFDRLLLPFAETGAEITHLVGVALIEAGPAAAGLL